MTALAATVALLSLNGAGAGFATTSGHEEAGFLALVDRERATRGLGGLAEAEDLVAVARRHSARMASENDVFHNAGLSSEVDGWELLGENVGVGPTVGDIHRALMESKVHRDVILQPRFTQVGVGVVVVGEEIWLTQVFRRPEERRVAGPAIRTAPADVGPLTTPPPPPVPTSAARTSTQPTASEAPAAPPAVTFSPQAVVAGAGPLPVPASRLGNPAAVPGAGAVAAGLLLAVVMAVALTRERLALYPPRPDASGGTPP